MENQMSPLMIFFRFVESRTSHKQVGAVAIEYALLGALIALAIVLAVTGVGTALIALFTAVAGKLVAP